MSCLREEHQLPGGDVSYYNDRSARDRAEVSYRPSEMEHARKLVLVDPQLLETLRSPPPPPLPTDTLGKKVQALDDEMMTILDRKDLDDRTKVTLYNQVLQRHNVLSDKHVKEPVRVVSVNESMLAAASGMGSVKGVGSGPVVEGAVGAPSSGIEADVVDTVPKTM